MPSGGPPISPPDRSRGERRAAGYAVFISYSRQDAEFVAPLREALEAAGRSVWLDEHEIGPAAPWRQEVAEAIEAAQAFVFVISPDAVSSVECRRELDQAIAVGKRLLPVEWRPASDVPTELAQLNWIRASREPLVNVVAALVSAIDVDYDWLQEHTQWLTSAMRWERTGESRSLLPRGSDLAAAESWLARQAEGKEPQPTALQTRFIVAARQSARRRLQVVAIAAVSALVVTIGLAALAFIERGKALDQRDRAESRDLAARGLGLMGEDVSLARLVTLEALSIKPTIEARSAVLTALESPERRDGALVGHTRPVWRAIFSPDGRTVASAGDDGTVRLWDLASHRQLGAPLPGGGGPVYALAFNADGSTLVAAGHDGIVRRWDTRRHRASATAFRADSGEVYGLALDRTGEFLVTGGTDRVVRRWDLRARPPRLLTEMRGHTDDVLDVALSPRGGLIASAGADHSVRLWSERIGKPLGAPLAGHRDNVWRLAFSPDGGTLASVGDHSARLWDLRGPRVTGHALATRTDLSFGAAFSPDSRTVAVAGQDQKVGLWDVGTRRRRDVKLAGRHLAGLVSLAFSPDGRLLAGWGTDNAVRLWDVGAPPRGLQSTVPSPRAAFRVAFDRTGRTCASSSGDHVDLWDWRSRRIRGQVNIGSVIIDLDLSADGRTLSVLRQDGKVQLIDVPTRRVRAPARILPGVHADQMALSPDGRMLAITDFDGRVFLASTASGRSLGHPLTRNPSGNVFAVAFSPDSRTLATGGGDLRSELWDVRARRRTGVLIGHDERVSDVAFSPDGSMLVSTGADRTVRRWDLRSRRQIGAPLVTGTGPASVVAVSPDGEAIAAANDAGTVRFWDAHTGRALGVPLRSRGASSIAFAPDGAGLVVGSQDPGVRLWTPAVWSDSQPALRDVVCANVRRVITRQEWAVYVPDRSYRSVCPLH